LRSKNSFEFLGATSLFGLDRANLDGLYPTAAHEVRQRARCHNCGVKGNNTYQIVYTGNSGGQSLVTSDLGRLGLLDVAMDGAGVRSAKDVH